MKKLTIGHSTGFAAEAAAKSFAGMSYDDIILVIPKAGKKIFVDVYAPLLKANNTEANHKKITDTIVEDYAKETKTDTKALLKKLLEAHNAVIAKLDEAYSDQLEAIGDETTDALAGLVETKTDEVVTPVAQSAQEIADAAKDAENGEGDDESFEVSELVNYIGSDLDNVAQHLGTLLLIAPYCSIQDMSQVPDHVRATLKASIAKGEAFLNK